MLRLRRAQIERSVGEERERLSRVEAHLRTVEWRDVAEIQDVVVKRTQPVRLAVATAAGPSHAEIGGAFARLLPAVIAHLGDVGAQPGISVGVYEDDGGSAPEGSLVLHAGFVVGDDDVPDIRRCAWVELPTVEVAAATYRGDDEGNPAASQELVRWIDASRYRLVGNCRELYHEWHDDGPSQNVMELQQPVAPEGTGATPSAD